MSNLQVDYTVFPKDTKDTESKLPWPLVHFVGYENQPLRSACLNTPTMALGSEEVFIHKVTRRKSESENTILKEPCCFPP